MSIFDDLVENARSDVELLRKLDSQGDTFSISRDVEFFIRCPSKERAEAACGFINDYQFGVATVQESEGKFSLLVVVNMPIEQRPLLCVSGFMACISHLFELDLDGWGALFKSTSNYSFQRTPVHRLRFLHALRRRRR